MKTSKKNSKQRAKKLQKRAKRLAAYSAAAAATVMTTQSRTANAADIVHDILDIQTSNINAVFLNLPTQSIGYSQLDSGWGNSSEGEFLINQAWFYAPLNDYYGAFANPATCYSCGTYVGAYLSVNPLPHTSGPISAGLNFAARYGSYSFFGNSANEYYFKYPTASNAILGLQFTLSEQTHYGWIALSSVDANYLIHGFGYNDTPGAPSTPDLTTVDLPGDIDRDGDVDADDWVDFRNNGGADLSAMTREDAYGLGDITHDGLNDIRDFQIFRAAYEAENGGGSFAAMVAAAAVPEPSSIMLLAAGAAGLGTWRKKRSG